MQLYVHRRRLRKPLRLQPRQIGIAEALQIGRSAHDVRRAHLRLRGRRRLRLAVVLEIIERERLWARRERERAEQHRLGVRAAW